MQSGPPYRQEQDPIDQSFSQSYYHQDHLGAGIVSKDPEYSGILQTPVPVVTLKEIDCKSQM
jgi:hypothetical protein